MMRWARSLYCALGRRRWWSIAAVGIFSLLLGVVVSLAWPPAPEVHDEFSYLLAADTFSEGRITNRTHPFWRHFESIHIIHQPSYMSKYPPANGLLLAAGQVLAGDPIVGVWIGTALAASCLCWMLQGWLPSRWALTGSLLVVFHPKLQLYWGQAYWGGSVALLGGALVLGSYPRLLRKVRIQHSLALAIGLAVLANSRPFEGLVVGLIVLVGLMWRQLRASKADSVCPAWPCDARLRFILPLSLALVPTAGMMLWYNQRITGDPLTMPYQVHERTYMPTPLFLWQEPRQVPTTPHAALAAFYERTLEVYQAQKRLSFALAQRIRIIVGFWLFFVGIALTATMLPLTQMLRRRNVRFSVAALSVAFVISCLGVWLQPHYLAPVVPLLILLLVEGLRHLRTWRPWGRPAGRFLVRGLVLLHIVTFTVAAVEHCQRPDSWGRHRREIEDTLQRAPGHHLVLVQYSDHHNYLQEWVYNRADIDGSRIVWARTMSARENQRLFDHFSDRRIWWLDADTEPPRIREIPRSQP